MKMTEERLSRTSVCKSRLKRGDNVRRNGKVFKFRRKNDFPIVLFLILCLLPIETICSEEREQQSKLENSFHNAKLTNRTISLDSWMPFPAATSPNATASLSVTSSTTSTTVAPSKTCRPACSNGICDASTGSCVCNPGWRGDQCDLCGGKVR